MRFHCTKCSRDVETWCNDCGFCWEDCVCGKTVHISVTNFFKLQSDENGNARFQGIKVEGLKPNTLYFMGKT